MAQLINENITVDEMINVLKAHSEKGRGGMMIDIIQACDADVVFFNIVKIKVSNMLDIYIDKEGK